MAKRSDFAQKLLDDLRSRKERMAVSQSSKGSKSAAPDVYSYSKQTHRGGSRDMKTNRSNGIRSGGVHNRTSGSSRSLSIGEASTEIVPFGRGRGSEQIGDLSMALAFALENGGKFRRMDSPGNSSVLGFLHQIGRRPVEVSKMERSGMDRHHSSSNRFPTLSHLHIKEISKGAQKLNQILRACSNGLNFESYSIEVGKELLKEAMDLEESLRMLVNLQKASEYMICPQRKSRITLLDEDEDDDDISAKTAEHNQLALPRFSFDKHSKYSPCIQKVEMTDLRQRIMAMTYSSEAASFNHDKHNLSTSNSGSHRKSSSYGSTTKTLAALSEQKNQSNSLKSNPEKARIPNVIAKLMGLEEVLENADSKHTKKESSSKQRNATNRSTERSSTRERNTKDAENSVPTVRKQKQMQPNQNKTSQDSKHALQAKKNLSNHHASFEMAMHDGKKPEKEVDGTKPERGSNIANEKMERRQSNAIQMKQSTGTRKNVQDKEREQDNTKTREQKGREQGETRKLIRKHELQQMASEAQIWSEAANTLEGKTEHNASMHRIEKRDENWHLSNDQPKPSNDLGFQPAHTFLNFQQRDIKYHAGEWQTARQKIQDRSQKGSEVMSKNFPTPMNDILNFQRRHSQVNQATPGSRSSRQFVDEMPSKGIPTNRHHEDPVYERISNKVQDSMTRYSNQDSSPIDPRYDMMEKSSTPTMEEKAAHPPATQKVRNTKGQKPETPRKIDELSSRKSGTPYSLARQQKHLTSALQEGKQKRRSKLGGSKVEQVIAFRSREAEARIVKSSKSMSNIQQPNVLEDLHGKDEQAPNSFIHVEEENQILKGPRFLVPSDSFQNTISTVTNEQQGQKLGRDQLQSHNFVPDSLNETHQASKDITYPSQVENQKALKLETPEPLNESQNHLKQILIKSQLFLNTAEALFKLNIPFVALHAGSQDYHDEESRLILDCGYEIMKRKGKRKELSVHPFMKISVTSIKVKSLDNLIKLLCKDLDKLKFYGRDGNAECATLVEDYLPKMLECDVYNWDIDVNCMWDCGWDKKMFAFHEKDDVIRDVEKVVLDGLLDEVAKDLLPVF
ncbi:hypothetical protein SADUNF_Sadunf14G0139200 [Salix dunnii]|uniref:DUF3741 domain-containing protein n=1 Tax=Salix dunnii TaxID=1413687 RepID=A0A835MU63_9ROSI|nr:hypothetical protein SADUNF_Sadunf14G0139200 [Salix dunnii]